MTRRIALAVALVLATTAAASPAAPAREPWLTIAVAVFSLLGLFAAVDLMRAAARRAPRRQQLRRD